MPIELRPYQSLNVMQLRQQFVHHPRVMYQAGTGSGKTVVANSIMQAAAAKGNYCWFIAHRRELIEQTAEKLVRDCGANPGIIMAGYRPELHKQIQVGSIDTLRERFIKRDKLKVMHPPKLIIIDEAHRALAKTYRDLVAMFPDAYVLGLSATPIRSDGRGLGHMFDSMVTAPSVQELIDMGFLVKPRYFTGATADLEGVDIQNYDYARAQLQRRMMDVDLRGDVVEQWLRHGEGRKTIVFASGVRHSIALQKDFEDAGIRAAHIDAKTPLRDRHDIIRDFRNSDKYQVITNCMILTEGFDCPEVGCVSLACPTRIISKYLQMGGRCLRPHEPSGKKDCIIIDHAGSVLEHGFLEDPVPWALDTDGRITDRIPEVREHMERQFECRECGCVFAGRVRCPECGTRLEVQGEELIATPEELIEITRGQMGAKAADEQKTYTMAQKQRFYSELLRYASGDNPSRKTYKEGWISHTYRAKFGVWPRQMKNEKADEVSPAVRAFIRAKNAAYFIRRNYNENRRAEAG